jgi:ATPase subunit of ABC transporter with duplicated ATPase domains
MGFIELADVAYALPGGWTLFEGVSFRVPEGEHAGLVGANGIGSRRCSAHRRRRPPDRGLDPDRRTGRADAAVHRLRRAPDTVRDFLLAYAEPRVSEAAIRVAKAERWMRDHPGEEAQMRYADALATGARPAGTRPRCCSTSARTRRSGRGYPECAERKIETLSGGERKRLALEVILRSRFDTVMLDEPDNALDIEGKRWLEDAIAASPKTVLFVSHDRHRARPRRDQDRHARGARRVDAPRRVLGLRAARDARSTGSTRITGATRPSTGGSRTW